MLQGILRYLFWIDTRNMGADGLTKMVVSSAAMIAFDIARLKEELRARRSSMRRMTRKG